METWKKALKQSYWRLHQFCESPVCLQCIRHPLGPSRSDRVLPHTEPQNACEKNCTDYSSSYECAHTYSSLIAQHYRTHFSDINLRLHCSTSARAWAPSSSMELFWKLMSGKEMEQLLQVVWKYFVCMSQRICSTYTHLIDTSTWFSFKASARNFAPFEPMLLFRRLNY